MSRYKGEIMKFKQYLQEKYYSDIPRVNDSVDNGNSAVQQHVKYDLLLFYGDYNPITTEEYTNIFNFINDFVPKNKNMFSEKLEIGLLCDYKDEYTNNETHKQEYKLLLDEMQFITTKLFGLKLYPIDFKSINELIKLTDTPYESQVLNDTIKELTVKFKRHFLHDNALVVLRPQDSIKLLSEVSNLTSEDINIGFMVYHNKYKEQSDLLSRIPHNSDIIKLICILDYYRPNPEDIRTFCFKYKMADMIEHAKRIHFKTSNEYYFDAFKLLFPNLNTSIDNVNVNDANLKVVFEMLKRMYLKRDLK
jgi:hypothetical protein